MPSLAYPAVKGGNFGVMSVEDMIAKLQQEIADKVHD